VPEIGDRVQDARCRLAVDDDNHRDLRVGRQPPLDLLRIEGLIFRHAIRERFDPGHP